MKKITLSLLIALGAFTFGSANAQCVANGTLTPTGTPGQFTITDLSSAGNAPFSFFQSPTSSTSPTSTVNLQPSTTTGTFQYTQNGTYMYTITIFDSLIGCTAVYTDSVVVTGLPNTPVTCVANATLTPTGTPGEFTITDLSTAGTQPYSYFQTYVNATIGTQNVPLQAATTTGTFQYPANGTYSWGVMITDSLTGCFDAYWDSVTVTGMGTPPPPPPGNCMASFTLQQDSLNQNQYWAWNTSTASSPALSLTYLWDFGDGNTSTQAYPTHTYNGLGTYTICLTVSDSICTSVTCDTIVITVKAAGTTINVLPPGAGLSLGENTNIQSIVAYPNPSNGNFILDIASLNDSELEVSILNIAGQQVYTELYSVTSGSNKLNVNQQDLSNGVYLLRVNEVNTGASKMIRIVKK